MALMTKSTSRFVSWLTRVTDGISPAVTLQSPAAFYSYKVVAHAGAVVLLNLKTVPAF